MLEFDHIAVVGETLDEATHHCEAALGTPLLPGGKHAHFATHNRLLGLGDGVYLEAISIDPAAPPPNVPRWFGLDEFSGSPKLSAWVCRVPDLGEALAQLPEAGSAVELERDGLRWSMAVPRDGRLPFDGMFPALIQWQSPVPPGFALPSENRRLVSLTVSHPEADAIERRLAPFLQDARIRFVVNGRAHLRAVIETSDGLRQLS